MFCQNYLESRFIHSLISSIDVYRVYYTKESRRAVATSEVAEGISVS